MRLSWNCKSDPKPETSQQKHHSELKQGAESCTRHAWTGVFVYFNGFNTIPGQVGSFSKTIFTFEWFCRTNSLHHLTNSSYSRSIYTSHTVYASKRTYFCLLSPSLSLTAVGLMSFSQTPQNEEWAPPNTRWPPLYVKSEFSSQNLRWWVFEHVLSLKSVWQTHIYSSGAFSK